MNTKELINNALKVSLGLMKTYLKDLSDAEIMLRPAKNTNHIAWQLGHIIAAEQQLFSEIFPESYRALPAGFADKHTKETCGDDSPNNFYPASQYIAVMEQVREDTINALTNIPESKLDEPSPERLRMIAPKLGDMFLFAASHFTMHSGQIAVLRRSLDKPVVI
jgi:uncharacterized damage-inducible protein DinB